MPSRPPGQPPAALDGLLAIVAPVPRATDAPVLGIPLDADAVPTLDAVQGHCGKPREIKPSLREFEALLAHEEKVNA